MNFNKNIIAWHPVLTDHQSYTYQALTKFTKTPIEVIVGSKEDPIRKKNGWTSATLEGIKINEISKLFFLLFAIIKLFQTRDKIHVFGSPLEKFKFTFLIYLASILKVKVYIISEPYSDVPFSYLSHKNGIFEKIKFKLRPLIYRLFIILTGSNLKGIFAISVLAIEQYLKAGMYHNKIFPFGYFVPKIQFSDCKEFVVNKSLDKKLKLIFIGSLIKRKGIDILINSFKEANAIGANLELDIFGPGVNFQNELCDGINLKGVITFGKAQCIIPNYDLLILPSYYDGWGVVINEALIASVPVLCSDKVGAGIIVKKFGSGIIFPSGDIESLTNILIKISKDRKILQALKLKCKIAAENLDPIVAAKYMFEIFQDAPTNKISISSPWY